MGRTDGPGGSVIPAATRDLEAVARPSHPSPGVWELAEEERGNLGGKGGRAATAGLTSPPLTWVGDDLKQAWGWVGPGAKSVGCC